MTNFEVRTRLTELQSVFPAGKHWNHKSGESESLNSYSETPCGTDGYTCNHFSGGSQCYAFANYMAQLVFGSYPTCGSAPEASNGTIYNGWKVYTADYCENLTIEPGDIIRAWGMNRNGTRSKHSAIVHYVNGNTVQVAECWGTEGCKIAWGDFNGYSYNNLTYLKDAENVIFIAKAPKTGKTCKISNYGNGKYLNVVGTALSNNQSVTTLGSNSTDGQKWYINGFYNDEYIRSVVDADYVLSTGSSGACVLSNNDSSQSNMVDIVVVGENSSGKICVIRKSNDNFTCLASDGTRAYWTTYSSSNNLHKWVFAEL